jgi:RND family efflux transporter MFP subunit
VIHHAELRIRPSVALAIAIALLCAGGAIAYLVLTPHARSESRVTPERTQMSKPPATGTPVEPIAAKPAAASRIENDHRLPDVAVPLGEEAVARAGIVTAVVTTAPGASTIRLPGVVEPNAYKQVAVTPLVSGRLTQVTPVLGAHVKQGQPLAQVYSPELAEAQTRYVSARAMLDAHDRELQRTEKLVAIGAASRQELERAHAEHAAQLAELESTRSRLLLLGVSALTIDGLSAGKSVGSTATIYAPIDGVVIERLANAGLNVDPSTKLFTIVDLGTVWIVADVYEKDLARVSIGASVSITTAAFPDRSLEGRVSYIDPQVSAATRTAKVRVEVPNPLGELRLGMYAAVLVRSPDAGGSIGIPRTAVQQVGDRQVVYLKSQQPGQFIQREVKISSIRGDWADVFSGLQPGDVIVTTGSFFVRAEQERLGLGQPSRSRPAEARPDSTARASAQDDVQNARVEVTEQGFAPSALTLRAGVPARVTFIRVTDKTCAKEVVLPSMNIRRTLPLNQPVVVDFTPQRGEVTFECGMKMFKGTVVIE